MWKYSLKFGVILRISEYARKRTALLSFPVPGKGNYYFLCAVIHMYMHAKWQLQSSCKIKQWSKASWKHPNFRNGRWKINHCLHSRPARIFGYIQSRSLNLLSTNKHIFNFWNKLSNFPFKKNSSSHLKKNWGRVLIKFLNVGFH